MTSRYIVTYDIADSKRWARVFRIMKGAGQHVQLSVFSCDLSARQREALALELSEVIHARDDQVLFIELGPTDGPLARRITGLGRGCDIEDPGPVIA
jgi:CRISPR-associated protein Cas2